jgi:hypothetical protein
MAGLFEGLENFLLNNEFGQKLMSFIAPIMGGEFGQLFAGMSDPKTAPDHNIASNNGAELTKDVANAQQADGITGPDGELQEILGVTQTGNGTYVVETKVPDDNSTEKDANEPDPDNLVASNNPAPSVVG